MLRVDLYMKLTQAEDTLADYARAGLTLGLNPMAQIRDRLRAARCVDSRTLGLRSHNSYARVAGIVKMRQRPQTASRVTFLTVDISRPMTTNSILICRSPAMVLPYLLCRRKTITRTTYTSRWITTLRWQARACQRKCIYTLKIDTRSCLRPTSSPINAWSTLAKTWLKTIGMLP